MSSALAYGKELERGFEERRAQTLERFGSEVVNIVCANQDLKAGDTLSVFNVEMKEWVADLIPDEAFLTLDECVGQELTSPVASGQPISALNLEKVEESLHVPSGFVAVNLSDADKMGISLPAAAEKLFAYKIDAKDAELISAQVKILDSSEFASEQKLCIAVRMEDAAALLRAQAEGKLHFVLAADDVSIVPRDVENATSEDEASLDGSVVDETGALDDVKNSTDGSGAEEKSEATVKSDKNDKSDVKDDAKTDDTKADEKSDVKIDEKGEA